MNSPAQSQAKDIKRLHVEAAVLFAINNIPGVDKETLEKFLELVNVTGNFGSITEDQLIDKMSLIMKHIPGACQRSLLTVAELLDIRFPGQAASSEMPTAMIAQAKEPKLIGPAYQY